LKKRISLLCAFLSLALISCTGASWDKAKQEAASIRCAEANHAEISYISCLNKVAEENIAQGEKSVSKIDRTAMSSCESMNRTFISKKLACIRNQSYADGALLGYSQSLALANHAGTALMLKGIGEVRKKEKATGLKI
jgi:hypothetical protein